MDNTADLFQRVWASATRIRRRYQEMGYELDFEALAQAKDFPDMRCVIARVGTPAADERYSRYDLIDLSDEPRKPVTLDFSQVDDALLLLILMDRIKQQGTETASDLCRKLRGVLEGLAKLEDGKKNHVIVHRERGKAKDGEEGEEEDDLDDDEEEDKAPAKP